MTSVGIIILGTRSSLNLFAVLFYVPIAMSVPDSSLNTFGRKKTKIRRYLSLFMQIFFFFSEYGRLLPT